MGGFAPKGHARVDPLRPAAFAICDRCGFQYNHRDLRGQSEWHGRQLRPTGWLVCERCWDVPNPTLRPIVLPPDPVPIQNPRREKEMPGLCITADDTNHTADSFRYTADNLCVEVHSDFNGDFGYDFRIAEWMEGQAMDEIVSTAWSSGYSNGYGALGRAEPEDRGGWSIGYNEGY